MQFETAPIRYQTKQAMVYHTVRNAIMQCQLKPGQRVIAEEIAQQLQVSHIPVREALQQLQSDGLVENVPHIGARVAPISPLSVAEVFTLMEGLELVASRLVCQARTEADLTELETILLQMDDALEQKQPEGWADLNTQFHLKIAHITSMPILQEMTGRVLNHWDRVRRYFFKSVLSYRVYQAQEEHRATFAAIKAQDVDQLETLVKAHNRGALAAYMDTMKQGESNA